jgi:hypothetical protein
MVRERFAAPEDDINRVLMERAVRTVRDAVIDQLRAAIGFPT